MSGRGAVEQPLAASHSSARSDPREAGRWLRQQLAGMEDWGYFGPGSAIWLLQRAAVLGVGLGRALLLQLAHPWVAQGIVDHSTFREQPLDRLVSTVIAAELFVFGSRRQADDAAARLRRVHDRINGALRETTGIWPAGTPYTANDPAALLWVLVTLLDTSLRVYEASLGRLPDHTVRAYLKDGARFGEMLGVPARTVPAGRAQLKHYIATMIDSGTVAVGSSAREVATTLLHAQVRPGLSWRSFSAITHAVAAYTLPRALRAQYGAILTVHHQPLYRMGGIVGRALLPKLPERLRLDPIAAIAIRRAMHGEQPA